jgi:rod shape-determining protein MreC
VTPRRRARTLFLGLMLTALVLIALDARDAAEPARGSATAGIAPLQSPLARALQPVRDLDAAVRDLVTTRAENRRLRAENDELRARRTSVADLERQVADLRALVRMQERLDLDAVPARVIALAPSNFEWTLTIDAGASSGVERGMAVVSGSGLVGRVLLVTDDAARVLLVLDPNFSVAARAVGSDGLGLLDGRGSEPPRFSPLDARLAILEDQELVTATYPGSMIPAGVPIGLLGPREIGASRLRAAYAVRPYLTIATLDHVLVLRVPPAPEVPSFDDSSDVPVDVPGAPPREGPVTGGSGGGSDG